MTNLFFAAPAGLAALAAVGAVVVLYLYRRRRKPLAVTGLFLWGRPQLRTAGGRKRERLIRSRSFWLDLAAALALALAAGGLARRTEQVPLVIVLDDSFAMRSRDGREAARRAASTLFAEAAGRGGRVAVLLAGERPAVARAMTAAAPSEGESLFAAYDPVSRVGNLVAAVALAREMYGDGNDIRVVTNQTDTAYLNGLAAGAAHRIAGAGGNAAFTQLWRYADPERPGRERLAASWCNYADAPAETVVTVAVEGGEGALLHRAATALPPGGTGTFEVEIAGAADKTWRVELATTGEDAIAEDSLAFLPPQPRAAVTYEVDGLSPVAERSVALALDAAGARRAVDADLLVSVGDRDDGQTLVVRVIEATRPGVATPPYTMDYASPLCRDLDLSGVAWVASSPAVPNDIDDVYIAGGGVPLLWRTGRERFFLNMAVETSPAVNDPAWPILWTNLARHCLERLPGLRHTLYRPGEPLRFNHGTERLTLRLRDADGRPTTFSGLSPRKAGRYALLAGAEDAGEIAVLPLYGDASDTRLLCVQTETLRLEGAAEGEAQPVDLRGGCLAAALILLFVNWRLARADAEGDDA